MVNGTQALGEAIANMSDVNMASEMSKALEIVSMITVTSQCSIDWSKDWSEKAYQYFVDSLSVVEDPSYTAKAAADYSFYQEDMQLGQTGLGMQDNILQSNKTVLKTLGNAMDQVYSVMQGPMEAQKAVNRIILIMGN
jgi:hypothetical protein